MEYYKLFKLVVMHTRESFEEKLAKLAQECERKLTNQEWVKERLGWEDWEGLRREAVAMAELVLKRRRRGMVLPGGYDAESIADQVIADVLEGKGRIAPGWTRARLMKELERLVLGKIRLLQMLKETSVTGTEWRRNANGQEVSVLANVRDESANGHERLVGQEEEQRREQLVGKVKEFLAAEPELAGLFECRCQGMTNPAKIAERLGMDEAALIRARKRLDRRLAVFRPKPAGESARDGESDTRKQR